MKTVHFHVGLPRCASTLIENVFFESRFEPYQRLKKAGVVPLPRLSRELRRSAGRPRLGESLCRRLREYHLLPALGDERDAFFASDESFTAFEDAPGARPVYADRARFMAEMLDGFRPHVILIVRNQVAYVESLYSLSLQNGGTLAFEEYLERFPLENLDWLDVAETFAEAVGEANLTVIPFERSAYADDAPYEDFFGSSGIIGFG